MNFSSANIKHLSIIGNGFDIHHGVNSSFLNFRNWLEKKCWKVPSVRTNTI